MGRNENVGIPGTGGVLDALWRNRGGLYKTALVAFAIAGATRLSGHAVDIHGTIPGSVNINGEERHLSGGIVFGDEGAAGDRGEANGHDLPISPFDLFEISISVGGEDIGNAVDFPGKPESTDDASQVLPIVSAELTPVLDASTTA